MVWMGGKNWAAYPLINTILLVQTSRWQDSGRVEIPYRYSAFFLFLLNIFRSYMNNK